MTNDFLEKRSARVRARCRSGAPVEIARPDAYHMFRGVSDHPRVPIIAARSCLEGEGKSEMEIVRVSESEKAGRRVGQHVTYDIRGFPEDLCGYTNQTSFSLLKFSSSHARQSSLLTTYSVLSLSTITPILR